MSSFRSGAMILFGCFLVRHLFGRIAQRQGSAEEADSQAVPSEDFVPSTYGQVLLSGSICL